MNRYGRYTRAAFDAQMRASLPALDATEGPQDTPRVLRGHEIWIAEGLPDVSREIDRCRPGAPAAGSVRTSSGSDARRGDHRHSSSDTLRRNDARRAPSARPDTQCVFRDCAKIRGSRMVKSGDFRAEFDEGGGLKNRCRFERKSWILQVLISRILSVCGEVAERLKAAVC